MERTWSGELGKLDTHVDTQNGSCQFVDVNCPNNCGESHQRYHLANHLSDLCPKRPFTCKYCEFKAAYEQVCNDHYPKCVKYPVPCPNKCEIGTVERGNLEQHVSECPLQVVECEFAHAGCSEKITQKDLPKHMELSMQKHLVLLSSYCVKELAEKDKQVEVLRGRVRTLEVVNCLLPIEFTLGNYSRYERTCKRVGGAWSVLCTAPKIQIIFNFLAWPPGALFSNFPEAGVAVELHQRPGECDDRVNWPVKCTLTATLLNQSSDQHHISRSRDYVLSWPSKESRIDPNVLYVPYPTIKDRSQQDRTYLKDDNLKFRFLLELT